MTLGEARIAIRANLAPLRSGLKRARSMLRSGLLSIASSAMRAVTNMIGSVMRAITRAIKRAVQISVAAFVALGVASVKAAMDVQESENLFDVTMKDLAESTRKWSEQMAEDLGLNEFALRKMTGTFHLMFKAFGIGAKESAKMSEGIVELTHDMASFYNYSFDEMFAKIQSGLSGMVRPLRHLGILVGEGAVQREALASGLIKEKRELTDLEKLYTRYNILMKQTTDAQGDLLRTKDNLQNVMRRLWAEVTRVRVAIGKVFITDVANWANSIREWLKVNKDNFAEWAEFVKVRLQWVINYFQWLLDIVQNQGWHAALSQLGMDIQAALKITWTYIKPHAKAAGEAMARAFLTAVKAGKMAAAESKFGMKVERAVGTFPPVAVGMAIVRGGAMGSQDRLEGILNRIVGRLDSDARQRFAIVGGDL